jgi:hypothetical protein
MAKPKNPPEPDDEADDDPPEPDEDAAWAKAGPRLKGIFKETLDEWLSDHAATDAPGDGASATGGGTANGAGGTGAAGQKDQKRQRTSPRPSGGSILDVLLGR